MRNIYCDNNCPQYLFSQSSLDFTSMHKVYFTPAEIRGDLVTHGLRIVYSLIKEQLVNRQEQI
jgi:hypothetical protein